MTRAEHLIKREARLRDGRTIWEPLWRNLGQFILPRKTNVLLGRQGGEKQTQKLFDSTAIHANEVLTASIHGALTNPIIRWFSLRMREKALNEVQEISLWLEDCSERIFLALQNSNFSTQINEVYLDLGAFGTAAILAEEKAISHGGFNGFVFRALTIGEYVIAEDAEGVVDTIFRRFTFPARVVVKKWPTASDVVKKLAERDSETPVTILHAVFPREDAKGGLRASRGKPFASFFVEVDTKTLLSEGGYDEFPYMVPRWATASSEIYGRGPGFTALPDTMTLNRAKEFDLKSWAKKLDPPIQSLDDGVIGTPDLTPGANNSVRVMDAIKPIDFGGDHRVNMLEAGDLRASIRQIFFNDQLQLPDKTIITATEVERRLELMQRILGPTIGRLESELLNNVLTRSFGLMFRAGALLPPPPAVIEAAQTQNGNIDIQYEGPLARAQRGSELLSVERFYSLSTPIATMNPAVLDNVNDDEIVRGIARDSGLPARYLRDEREVEQLRAVREQERQRTQQLAEAQVMAESAGKVAPLVKMGMEGAGGNAGMG